MRNPSHEKDIVGLSAQLGPYTDTMNKTEKALFEASAFNQVIAFQQEKRRPPNSEERRKILDDLKMDVVTHKGVLWDSKTPKYKLTPEQQAAQPTAAPRRVSTEADYNQLPKGARYIAPDGTTRTKQ